MNARETLERWLNGLESLSQEEVQELVREALSEVKRLKKDYEIVYEDLQRVYRQRRRDRAAKSAVRSGLRA